MKIYSLITILLVSIFVSSCSKDDEPKLINTDLISGTWYLTNIKGWEYEEDKPNKKSEFNYTFNFDAQGVPVGDTDMESHQIIITYLGNDSESGISHLKVDSYYWSLYSKEWKFNDGGTVTLKGNEMINGTMKVKVTKLTDTTMTTYQKEEDGETYITYVRV